MNRIASLGIAGMLLLWVSGTALAFWHFEGQYLRPANARLGQQSPTRSDCLRPLTAVWKRIKGRSA